MYAFGLENHTLWMEKGQMAQSQVAKEILRHRGNLFGFAFSLARDFGLAEERSQEACARILDRQEQFVEGTNFSA